MMLEAMLEGKGWAMLEVMLEAMRESVLHYAATSH